MKRKVGFKPRSKPMKRTAIRKVSVKRRAEAKVYTIKRKRFLEENILCCACCQIFGYLDFHRSEEVHHKELRGPNYLKESTWLPVCHRAHLWIHSNARAARVLGLLK